MSQGRKAYPVSSKQHSKSVDKQSDELKQSLGTEGIFGVKENYKPVQYKRPSKAKKALKDGVDISKAILLIVGICLLMSLIGTLLAMWASSREDKQPSGCIQVDYKQVECLDN